MDIKGVGPEVETVTNEQGGRQSASPFAFHLTDPLVEFEFAKLLAEGSKKYKRDNWRKIPIEEHLNHALQHIHAYRAGDEQEDNHLVHALARLHFAVALDLEKDKCSESKENLESLKVTKDNLGPVGSRYKVVVSRPGFFEVGDIVELVYNDGTDTPYFRNLNKPNIDYNCMHLDRLEKLPFCFNYLGKVCQDSSCAVKGYCDCYKTLRYKDLKLGQKFNFVKNCLRHHTHYTKLDKGYSLDNYIFFPKDGDYVPQGTATTRYINDEVILVKE